MAIESGYRMIDTAEAYGNEKEVGEGIRQSGIDRRELFLVTKVNFKSYEHAEQTVLQSLADLQTDYLDLLLLHWPFANYYAAWRVLEKLYADGKVRAIGVSNFEPDQLLDLIAYHKIVPAVDQIGNYRILPGFCIFLVEQQIGIGGVGPAGLAHQSLQSICILPGIGHIPQKHIVAVIRPAQVLLRFLTQKGIAVIPRSTQPEHIKENFDLFDFALTAEELARLSALDRKEPLIGKAETPELVEFSLTW